MAKWVVTINGIDSEVIAETREDAIQEVAKLHENIVFILPGPQAGVVIPGPVEKAKVVTRLIKI